MISIPTLKQKTKIYTAEALGIDWYDGDTPKVLLGFGFGSYRLIKLRLELFDTPELDANNPMEAEVAKMCRGGCEKIIDFASKERIDVQSNLKITYDRYQGNIYMHRLAATMTDVLTKAGLGRISPGHKRLPWTDDDLHNVAESYDKFIQNPTDLYEFFLVRKSNSYGELE